MDGLNGKNIILWQWEQEETESSLTEEKTDSLSTDSDLSENEETEAEDKVRFKCIGVTRDVSYQSCLKEVNSQLMEGKYVPVRLVPEPDNPYDSRAINFQCELNKKWKIIGYVVKELCDAVHEALSENKIVSTEFAWVKYKVLHTTGPGYYAAIDITRKGNWPPRVHSCSNTMF